jgi:hypothetical protein
MNKVCKTEYAAAVKKFGKKEVDLGIKLEQEHHIPPCKALNVTLDHLKEFDNYNTQLVKFEALLKQGKRLK